jgi:hypothetical protein
MSPPRCPKYASDINPSHSADLDLLDIKRRPKTEAQKLRGFQSARIGALTKVFGNRYGGGKLYRFTEDDAGREDLRILLDHYAHSNPIAIPRIIKARAPFLMETERETMLDMVARFPRHWTSPALAEALNLTEKERIALGGVRTIGAVDVTPQQRAQKRKDRDRDRKRRKRRAALIQPRAEWLAANSKSREKPWEAAGMSRRTWYRKRGTGPSTNKIINRTDTLVPKVEQVPRPTLTGAGMDLPPMPCPLTATARVGRVYGQVVVRPSICIPEMKLAA